MKKAIMVFSLMPLLLFANDNLEANNIINSASEGREVIKEQTLSSTETSKKDTKDKPPYYYEVILNYENFYNAQNTRGTEVVGKTQKDLFVKNVKETPQEPNKNEKKPVELIAVKGYCFILDEINVGKQPSSIRIDCQSNHGAITMFANLVNVNEKASLLADPKYIEKNGYRFNVKSAVVLNEEKTSYNLATFVNDRKIAQVGWHSISYSAEELKNSTNEYLQALQESKKQQNIEYYTSTDTQGNGYIAPIQNTNTLPPDPMDYVYTAGINIFSDIVKTTADIFKADLPYLYQIVPDTKIWIDLQVEKEGTYVK